MAEYQTTVNNLNVIRGSGLVEVAAYIDGEPEWHNVGAIKGLSVEEMFTVAKEENDNADSTDRINKQELSIKFTQLELLKLITWTTMRSTLDTVIEESGIVKIQSGAATEIPFFMLRITTKNSGHPFYFTAYKCQIQKGFNLQYQKDDGDDARIQNPVEVIGKSDSNRGGFVYELVGDFDELES